MRWDFYMWKWIKVILFLLGAFALLLLNPMEIYTEMRTKGEVERMLSDQTVVEDLFDGDIEDFDYIGGKAYSVKTSDASFVVIVEKKNGRTQLETFVKISNVNQGQGY